MPSIRTATSCEVNWEITICLLLLLFAGFVNQLRSSLGGTLTWGNYSSTSRDPDAHRPVPVTPMTMGESDFGRPAFLIFFATLASASHMEL